MSNNKILQELRYTLPMFDINYLDHSSKSYRDYQESLYEQINYLLGKLDYDTALKVLETYLPPDRWDYPKEYHDGGEPFAIFLGDRRIATYAE